MKQGSEVHLRFSQMYEETLPIVFGFLHLRVGGNTSLAEDLTAETYAAAIKLFNTGRADEVTASWLRTVARRRLVDHWRRATVAADKIVLLSDRMPAGDDTDRAAVMEALAALSEDQRRALVLQHVEGYSVAEVAEMLGRSPKGTESLLSRARAAFKQAFEEVSHD